MITPLEYKVISDSLGSAETEGPEMLSSLFDMRNHFQDNELSKTSVEKSILTRAIDDVYRLVVRNHTTISIETLQIVQALQHHVEQETGTDFNDFLSSNGIKVSPDFADLSAACNYTVLPENVE